MKIRDASIGYRISPEAHDALYHVSCNILRV
jgi:hypothetical protein